MIITNLTQKSSFVFLLEASAELVASIGLLFYKRKGTFQ